MLTWLMFLVYLSCDHSAPAQCRTAYEAIHRSCSAYGQGTHCRIAQFPAITQQPQPAVHTLQPHFHAVTIYVVAKHLFNRTMSALESFCNDLCKDTYVRIRISLVQLILQVYLVYTKHTLHNSKSFRYILNKVYEWFVLATSYASDRAPLEQAPGINAP